MKPEELQKFEEILIGERDRLSREIKDVIEGTDMGEETADLSDEESDEAEERGVAFASQISLKESLNSVLDALQRIKAGTYGVCEKCKKDIELAVLKASPESRLCKECKQKS